MTFHRYVTFMLLSALLLLPAVNGADGQTLRMSTLEESPAQEISVKVLTEAYAALRIDLEIHRLPGQRALQQAGLGAFDGEVSRIAGLEREFSDLVRIPVAINQLQGTAFVADGSIRIERWSDLTPFYVGVIKGILYAEKGTRGMQRVFVTSHEQLLRMLKRGRIQVAVATYVNILPHLRKPEYEDVQSLAPPLVTRELFHYLHKRNRHLVPNITGQLQLMRDAGRLAEIRRIFMSRMRKDADGDGAGS